MGEHREDPASAARIVIPEGSRPADGRFGSGPSKVRPEAVEALARAASGYLGTSHRRAGVRAMVGRLRTGLRELFALPDDYEVVLGNGGSSMLWDALVFSFIRRKSQHLVFGEFSAKFAAAAALATHLDPPEVIESEPGTHPWARATPDIDVYALTQNETSTGVAMAVERPGGDGLVVVDATSAAGAAPIDPGEFDLYYFAPQKAFAADGGLWLALCSPRALERIEEIGDSTRYVPPSLDLLGALESSRDEQTYNTPALATLFLTVHTVEWILASGGLAWAVERSARSAHILYTWADKSEYALPFVADPADRSPTVATIDLDPATPADDVCAALRANGIVDTESYRKLGRNQLRIALYPAIDPADVERLTRAIDFVVDALAPGG
ncbi:MAG: phosphoserine transaminase [Actinomycetota bacterium]